ncbi:hypothetical protein GGI20_003066 [Coemansia sp. BCRC 34301]|nr:hypothetical protein GGI20_003066 [Coemansia sp. BCRC 34301]
MRLAGVVLRLQVLQTGSLAELQAGTVVELLRAEVQAELLREGLLVERRQVQVHWLGPLRVPLVVLRVPLVVLRVPLAVLRVPLAVLRVPLAVLRVPLAVLRVPLEGVSKHHLVEQERVQRQSQQERVQRQSQQELVQHQSRQEREQGCLPMYHLHANEA